VKHSTPLTQLIDALRALRVLARRRLSAWRSICSRKAGPGARALASALDVALESVVRCGVADAHGRSRCADMFCYTRESSAVVVSSESPADVGRDEHRAANEAGISCDGHLVTARCIGPEQLGVRTWKPFS